MADRSATDTALRFDEQKEGTPIELLRSLAVFAEPPGDEHARLTEVLGFSASPQPSDYSDVFLFQLYPYASVHLGSEGMMGGEARDRVAGFWRAIGQVPPAEPDHLAALVGLYAGLAEREGSLDGAERTLVRQSRRALLREHLAPWVFAFLHRVGEVTAGTYAEWAELLSEALRREFVACAGEGDDVLPLHLRMAEGLPDPRIEGGEAFLAGLLAPVRAGVLLTRADLARISAELALGLRAGERRYALRHLLAQDPVPVLRAVAKEAGRQGAIHETRRSWLGGMASFFARRAHATETVLEELALDGRSLLEGVDDGTIAALGER